MSVSGYNWMLHFTTISPSRVCSLKATSNGPKPSSRHLLRGHETHCLDRGRWLLMLVCPSSFCQIEVQHLGQLQKFETDSACETDGHGPILSIQKMSRWTSQQARCGFSVFKWLFTFVYYDCYRCCCVCVGILELQLFPNVSHVSKEVVTGKYPGHCWWLFEQFAACSEGVWWRKDSDLSQQCPIRLDHVFFWKLQDSLRDSALVTY